MMEATNITDAFLLTEHLRQVSKVIYSRIQLYLTPVKKDLSGYFLSSKHGFQEVGLSRRFGVNPRPLNPFKAEQSEHVIAGDPEEDRKQGLPQILNVLT